MFGVLQQLKVVIRAGKFTYCRFLQFTFKRNKQSFFVVTGVTIQRLTLDVHGFSQTQDNCVHGSGP